MERLEKIADGVTAGSVKARYNPYDEDDPEEDDPLEGEPWDAAYTEMMRAPREHPQIDEREMFDIKGHSIGTVETYAFSLKGKVYYYEVYNHLGERDAYDMQLLGGEEGLPDELRHRRVADEINRARRSWKENPSKYLFSYGSNSPRQLAERLGHSSPAKAAFLVGHKRVFRGYSTRWEGGVASLETRPGAMTYGFVATVSDADLDVLDKYEGVGSGKYRRAKFRVKTDGGMVDAIAYVSTSSKFSQPSREYLEACAETVGAFWQGSNDKVRWTDFDIS